MRLMDPADSGAIKSETMARPHSATGDRRKALRRMPTRPAIVDRIREVLPRLQPTDPIRMRRDRRVLRTIRTILVGRLGAPARVIIRRKLGEETSIVIDHRELAGSFWMLRKGATWPVVEMGAASFLLIYPTVFLCVSFSVVMC